MGCWNTICMVSQLPIYDSDEVAVIPIIRQKNFRLKHSMFYINSLYKPVPIVLFGKYDDYGNINNISGDLEQFYNFIENYTSLSEKEIYEKVNKYGDNNKEKAHIYLSLIERSDIRNKNKDYDDLAFIMIHKDLYEKLTTIESYFYNIDTIVESACKYMNTKKEMKEIKNRIKNNEDLSSNDLVTILNEIRNSNKDIDYIKINNIFEGLDTLNLSKKTMKDLYKLNSVLEELGKYWCPQITGQIDIDKSHKYLRDFYINKIKEFDEEREEE